MDSLEQKKCCNQGINVSERYITEKIKSNAEYKDAIFLKDRLKS